MPFVGVSESKWPLGGVRVLFTKSNDQFESRNWADEAAFRQVGFRLSLDLEFEGALDKKKPYWNINIFRCPACYENLLNIYCMTSCDPNQALWMEGVEGFKTISDQGLIFQNNPDHMFIRSYVNLKFLNGFGNRVLRWRCDRNINFEKLLESN